MSPRNAGYPGVLSPKSRKLKDFPGGPVCTWLQGARVWSLVGEPRFHMLRGAAKKKKKKQNQNAAPHQSSSTRIKLQPIAAIQWGEQEEAFCALDVHP